MFNRSRRRVLQTTGAAVAGGLLAGCLGGEDEQTFEPDGDAEASESVELDFLLSIGGDAAELAVEFAEEFTSMSDTISIDVREEGDYYDTWTQTLQGVRADDPPALVHLNAIHALPAAVNDAVVPIDRLLGSRTDDVDLLDPALDYYVFDDDLLALPFGMSTISLMYNVDAFEAAGLSTGPEDAPTTSFDELRETSETVVSNGPTSRAITWPVHSWWTESWFAMDGENYLNNGNGRDEPATEVRLDTETAESIYGWQRDLYENDRYLNAGFHGWGDARSAFLNEEVAIHLDSSSAIASMRDGAAEAGFESRVGMVPSPSAGNRNGLIIGGGALAVPRGNDDARLEAAAEFLLWMSQPEQQARWHTGTGYYPVSEGAMSILEDDGFYDENPGFRRAFDHLLESESTTATAGAMTLGHGEVRQTVDDAVIGQLFDDDPEPIDAMLSGIKSDVDEHLERQAADDPRN